MSRVNASSTLWQLERAQTQLRLRQSQARFWRPLVLAVWLGSASVTFWVRIGVTGRQLFWPWVQASGCAWCWPTHRVVLAGQWYEARPLAAWLTQTVYQQPLSSWLLESLLVGLLPALAAVIGGWGYLRWRFRPPPEAEHLRGVQLRSTVQLQAQIDGSCPWWHRNQRAASAVGLHIAGVTIPPALETSHVAIAGATGAGKSTILRSVLRQIAARGEVAIVLDPENELTPEFYDPQRGDVLLNPTDARAPSWSPWEEITETGDREALALSFLPDPPERGSGSEWYFLRSARELLVALFERLPTQDPSAIGQVLAGPADALFAMVQGTPAAAHVALEAPEQRSGVVATLQNAVSCLRFLPPLGDVRWSANAWAANRPGWVFLTCRERERAGVLALHAVWLDSCCRQLLGTDLTPPPKRVWIVIDELATVKRVAQLEALLTRGRKRGVAVVLGFQALTQLRGLYGRDTTATLLAAPATKLFLRTGEPETAHWCSRALGTHDVILPAESETAGPENVRDAISVAYQRKEEPIVLPSELQQLPERQGYLCLAGYDVARVAFPLLPTQFRQPSFVPREQTAETEEAEADDTDASTPSPLDAAERPVVVQPRPLPTADDSDAVADTVALQEDQAHLPLVSARTQRPGKRRLYPMLVMSKGALSAAQAATYYQDKYTQDDYYTEEQRITGQWTGIGATRLGLTGTVTRDAFQAVLRGQDPRTGAVLVPSTADGVHRAGWDATFNAPKSVSLQLLIGGDDRLRDAHRQAVAAALTELERAMQSRVEGGTRRVTTGTMVAAQFEHIAARPSRTGQRQGIGADPHLHTHVVIVNLTQRADGAWRGVEIRDVYRSQALATAVYRSTLARTVQEFGYAVTLTGQRGEWELSGYTRDTIAAFSQRRQDIEQQLAAKGVHGAAAAQLAAHTTRLGKAARTEAALRQEWQSRAQALGIALPGLTQEVHTRGPVVQDPEVARQAADAAVTFAQAHLTEREAVMSARQLETVTLQRGMGQIVLTEARQALHQQVSQGIVVPMPQEQGSEIRYTTQAMLDLEREILALRDAGREKAQPLATRAVVQPWAQRKGLSPEQTHAVVQTVTTREWLSAIEGKAGAAKTTTMGALRELLVAQGHTVRGFGPLVHALPLTAWGAGGGLLS